MQQSDQAHPQPTRKELVEGAINELRRAIAAKKVEPICAAYQALHEAAGVGEDEDIFQLMAPKTAEETKPFVVSAFSHRGCFMCQNGLVPCRQCSTTGELLDGKPCPLCKGFGLTACAYCRGTGWAVREMLPKELTRPVLEKQLAHVHEELTELSGTIGTGRSDELKKLPPDQKRTVAGWLIRIYARLTDLIRSDAIPDQQERERLGAIALRMRKCFMLMR